MNECKPLGAGSVMCVSGDGLVAVGMSDGEVVVMQAGALDTGDVVAQLRAGGGGGGGGGGRGGGGVMAVGPYTNFYVSAGMYGHFDPIQTDSGFGRIR